jgi:hypothetical protein
LFFCLEYNNDTNHGVSEKVATSDEEVPTGPGINLLTLLGNVTLIYIDSAENAAEGANHKSQPGVDQSDSNFIAMLEYEAGEHNLIFTANSS